MSNCIDMCTKNICFFNVEVSYLHKIYLQCYRNIPCTTYSVDPDVAKSKMADAEQSLVNGVTNLSVNGNEKSKESVDEFAKGWGFQLPELYKLAVRFYKGNSCDISNYL